MSSFDPRIVLRPRSLDETFDLALAYLRTSARDLIPLCAGLAVVGTGIVALASWIGGFELPDQLAAALLLAPVLERVITVYAGRHLFQTPGLLRSAFLAVLKQLPLILLGTALRTLPLLLLAYSKFEEESLIGFGVLLSFVWPFAIVPHMYLGEVIHLEQLPINRAIARARALVGYRYGRVFGLLTVAALVRGLFVVGIYSGITFVFGFMLQFEEVSSAFGIWAVIFGFLSAAPYLALVRLFDYVDARTRREGWDIQVRFHAIAQRERNKAAERSAA